MSEAIAFTLLGLLFLALGGDSLVKGAAGLAQGLRIPRFTIGLCLVAVATSLPELAVNARAVASGDRALALGNAVGSNIANIGLTLGLAALAAPLLLRWRALSPLLAVLLLATLGVVLLSLDGGLSRIEGLAMLLVFAGVVAFTAMRADDESPGVRAEVDAFTDTRGGAGLNMVRVAVAVVLLWFGAGWIVAQVPVIGHALGMDSLVAGLVLVAIGTALPEVAADEFLVRAAQRRLRVDIEMPGEIGQREQQVADLLRRCLAVAGDDLGLHLVDLLADLRQYGARVRPVEADLGRLVLQFHRAGEGRGAGRHPVQRAALPRLRRQSPRRATGGPLGLLLGLDRVPGGVDGGHVAPACVAEHMGMAPDHLGGDGLDHGAEIEGAALFAEAGVEHDLQQQVAQLVAEIVEIAARDGVRHLIGFLDGVGRNGGEVLREVPGAAGLRRAQCRHDLQQLPDVAGGREIALGMIRRRHIMENVHGRQWVVRLRMFWQVPVRA